MSLQTATNSALPSPAASASTGEPDRAQTFRAVEGGGETRSGSLLMVEAYAVLWLILLAWLVRVWRAQGRLHERIDGLEKAIDRGAAKLAQVEDTNKRAKPKA